MQNLKPLASLYSWAGQFEPYLIGNPEDRFSHDWAQMELKEASDKEPHLWPYWVVAHAHLKAHKTHNVKVPFLNRQLI